MQAVVGVCACMTKRSCPEATISTAGRPRHAASGSAAPQAPGMPHAWSMGDRFYFLAGLRRQAAAAASLHVRGDAVTRGWMTRHPSSPQAATARAPPAGRRGLRPPRPWHLGLRKNVGDAAALLDTSPSTAVGTHCTSGEAQAGRVPNHETPSTPALLSALFSSPSLSTSRHQIIGAARLPLPCVKLRLLPERPTCRPRTCSPRHVARRIRLPNTCADRFAVRV